MSYEIAKFLLEHADSVVEKTDAVRVALRLGMTLDQIEAYLDWIDFMRTEGNTAKGHGQGRGDKKVEPRGTKEEEQKEQDGPSSGDG